MRNIGTTVPQDHLVSHGRRLQIDDCKQPHLRIDPMRGARIRMIDLTKKAPGSLRKHSANSGESTLRILNSWR